jgi:hypothetical protein
MMLKETYPVTPLRPLHLPPRRGQTLVEFSLVLPLLILLIFGIIEMARLMQAYITMQNSARAAARYAAIGAVKWDIFDVPADPTKPLDQRVMDSIIPCTTTDERGTIQTVGNMQRYAGGSESLFATWYDGTNCDPRSEDHQQMRRDILRIFSAIHEARVVSGGLGLAPAYSGHNWDAITPTMAQNILYGVWQTPYPGEYDTAGYFYVDICSNRTFLDPESRPANDNRFFNRFVTIRNGTDRASVLGALKSEYASSIPLCMHNESPDPLNQRTDELQNAGHRWWDAGGPGDQVTVLIRYNHPWITPINPANGFITLNTRRSSINESFRAPKAVGAYQRSVPPGREDDPEPEDTLLPPDTATPVTPTPVTPDPPTATNTPIPFECSNIQLRWAADPFSGNTLFVSIQNENLEQVTLERVILEWYPNALFNNMYARAFSLNNDIHWQGGPVASPPQTRVNTSTNGMFDPDSFRTIGGMNSAVWQAMFLNGPQNLSSAFSINDFEIEITVRGPQNQTCDLLLLRPPQPTLPPDVTPTFTPTPSRTPDCATAQQLSISFNTFDSFDGSVSFDINNGSAGFTYLVGFALIWPDPTHPQIGRTAGSYYLRRVTVGGAGPGDIATQQVWTSTGVGQDATGNTRITLPYDVATSSANAAEGTFQTAAIIPPGLTRVYLDFDGFPGSLQNAFGVQRHHFSGSLFYFGCSRNGQGTGGGGSQPTGVIGVNEPSPTRTNTPRPSNTPGPTFTPSRTPTRTNTLLPSPTRTATQTFTPSSTPAAPTRTPIPTIVPTSGGGGG